MPQRNTNSTHVSSSHQIFLECSSPLLEHWDFSAHSRLKAKRHLARKTKYSTHQSPSMWPYNSKQL